MSESDLRQLISQLHDEIDRLGSDDELAKSRLTALVEDLERRLTNPDDSEDEGLVDNVQEAIRHFEVEYPHTTGILNHIMMTLSNMGI